MRQINIGQDEPNRTPEVSVVIPCLNEEASVGQCVREARQCLAEMGIPGEVIVADNGSTDRSVQNALQAGAIVVSVKQRGYGRALAGGLERARGSILVIGDADGSYDFREVERLVEAIRQGYDVVIGSRFLGQIEPGAMRWTSRIGNPLMTAIVNTLFGAQVTDSQSGMRAFTRSAYAKMSLQSAGMEWASEMIIKAMKAGLKITEVAIPFRKDLRNHPSHLRPFRDGWRHLKLMLTYSPTVLFLLPGLFLFFLGLLLMGVQIVAPMDQPLWLFGKLRMDFHWAILGSLLALTGWQIVASHFMAKIYSISHRFQEEDQLVTFLFRYVNADRLLILSLLSCCVGLVMTGWVAYDWWSRKFGALVSGHTRLVIFGSTLLALGIQNFFNAFLFSIIGDAYRRRE